MDYTMPKDALLVEPTPVAGEPRPSFLNTKINVKYMKERVNVMDFDGEIFFCILFICLIIETDWILLIF